MKAPRRTKIQNEHFNYLRDVMAQLEWDLHQPVVRGARIPEMWHEISADRGRKAKVKVTMGVEEDVVRFFKSMGKGYQLRMNDVLRAWMHGRIAGLIDGPDKVDAATLDNAKDPRPELGDATLADRGYFRIGG